MNYSFSREQAEKLIEEQMTTPTKPTESHCWHYGRCELKDLLDAIYGLKLLP